MINSYSVFSSLENLRGIVRQAKVRKSANSVVTDSLSRVTKRTVRQRFFSNNKVALFHFLLLHITTEAMGLGGLRANFLSWNDKGNAGAKTAKSTLAAQSA